MNAKRNLSVNEIASNLLDTIAVRCIDCKEQLSDEDLINLHSIFGNVFERAAEILEKRNKITFYTLENKSRTIVEIKGNSDCTYKVLPNINYCSCPAFQFHVLNSGSEVTCKHILATWLARITKKYSLQLISQQQYLSVAGEMFMIDGSFVSNMSRDVAGLSTQGTQYMFTAFLDNVKPLYSVLKAINFQESATFCSTSRGLKVTVEHSKCVQASAYIPADYFTEFNVSQDEDVEFRVSLTVLTECLNIFGSGGESSLKMYYKTHGEPLLLVLEHLNADDAMTDCEIKTQDPDELMDFTSSDSETTEVAMIVLKAPALFALLSDMDKMSEYVEFDFCPDHPRFTIITTGPQDKSRTEVPKSSDMVHSFTCKEQVNFSYKYSHIKLIVKSLSLANKVAIKIDSRGLLVIQQVIEKEEQKQMFVEYYITPQIDEDD